MACPVDRRRVGRGSDGPLLRRVRTSDAGRGSQVHRRRPGSRRRPTIRPTGGSARLRSVDGTQGNDYERRSYWQATMPALPDRSGRPLPDTADVVVIGGGYAGINAARELARGAPRSRCSRRTRSAGARPPATAASSTPATSGARPRSSSSYGAGDRQGALPGDPRRRTSWSSGSSPTRPSTATSASRPSRARLRRRRTSGSRAGAQSLASVGVTADLIPRERIREEIGSDAYYGALAVPDSGLVHPGPLFRRAGGGRGSRRRGPPRGRPGDGDPPAGRRAVRRRDRPRRDPRARRLRRHERLHGRRRAVAAAPDHRRSRATSSRASRSPRTWRGSSRRTAARSSTRRTTCTTGTSRPTAG